MGENGRALSEERSQKSRGLRPRLGELAELTVRRRESSEQQEGHTGWEEGIKQAHAATREMRRWWEREAGQLFQDRLMGEKGQRKDYFFNRN